MTLAMPGYHAPPRTVPDTCSPARLTSHSSAADKRVEPDTGQDAAENEDPRLLGETILKRCVEVLFDAYSTISPAYLARVERITRLVERVALELQLEQPEVLARLVLVSQLGILSLPESIVLRMHRGELLSSSERQVLRNAPDLGERLLAQVPGQERAREIVRLHDVHATPVGAMPVEAEVLRVAIGYDRLEAGGKTPHEALAILRDRAPMYSATVIDALEDYLAATRPFETERSVPISELVTGMILTADLLGHDGLLILGSGHEINTVTIESLRALVTKNVIDDVAWVRDPIPRE